MCMHPERVAALRDDLTKTKCLGEIEWEGVGEIKLTGEFSSMELRTIAKHMDRAHDAGIRAGDEAFLATWDTIHRDINAKEG